MKFFSKKSKCKKNSFGKKVLIVSGMMLALFMSAPMSNSPVINNMTGTMTVHAAETTYGSWESQGGTQWKLKMPDGSYACNTWYQDKDGSWYYLKSDGLMAEKVFTDTDGSVYLLDWNHDGHYGRLLTSGTYNGVTIQTNDAHDGTWGRILNTDVISSLKSAIGQSDTTTVEPSNPSNSSSPSKPSQPTNDDPWSHTSTPGGTSGGFKEGTYVG